ncbi:Alg9-like mannosyltransferase family-domain-containing protein, partial [Zopfochytrium polystomum]
QSLPKTPSTGPVSAIRNPPPRTSSLRPFQPPPYAPNFSVAFHCLLIARLISALYNIIADCDEVYNYWEPVHFLQFGNGLQTWEYSPEYSIRSWFYICIHSGIAWLASVTAAQKIQIFFVVRSTLAVASAVSEACLYRAVVDYGMPYTARYLLLFLLASTGMFISSTAFLPSSFSMYLTTLAFAVSLQRPSSMRSAIYVLLASISVLVGWPFAGATAIPFAIEDVFFSGAGRWRRLAALAMASVVCVGSLAFCIASVDSLFYKKWELVPWNIIAYNLFSGEGKGPDIYGTEPWYFYLLNGLLNFNLVFVAALLSLPVLIISSVFATTRRTMTVALKLLPFYLWLTIFSLQPHKEERFLFVVYPLLCFNAAYTISAAAEMMESRRGGAMAKMMSLTSKSAKTMFCIVFVLFSLSRTVGLHLHYSGPIHVFAHLYTSLAPPSAGLSSPVAVCIGKEWYRFPSHFFLPSTARLRFVRSSFEGLLPKPFAEGVRLTDATSTPPTGMNDRNEQVIDDRLVQEPVEGSCDYMIDYFGADSSAEPDGLYPNLKSDVETWEQVLCVPFLDAPNTVGILARTLWVPETLAASARQVVPSLVGEKKWGDYCLFHNRKKREMAGARATENNDEL